MKLKLEKLTMELLALPAKSRVFLVDKLVESLDEAPDPKVEQAWLEEAERRWKEIEVGKVTCIPVEQVMRKAYSGLKKCG